jgi:DNA invertase Pin-like site-specific DNA recombinase
MKTVRCAIYTRKSSEEGLDQAFNSLDAQREACAAYILSQASEGWVALPDIYDDGGLSGGTLERPALQRLLSAVAAGQVDIIVVYKVDRLTRSLLDFSKLVERFDKAGTSFVSVTQSFNTTTSMGRLTLNMLLSFAQFEREVTAERIRDKIAASKAKGMWMGGTPPIGYAPDGRSLRIIDSEAQLIRGIFDLYLELGNVRLVAERLEQGGVRSPTRTRARSGASFGGVPLSRGQIYGILKCATYVGEIHHKGQVYQGNHQPIVERDVWDQVQAKLAGNLRGHRSGERVARPCLLAGKVVDADGNSLIASHACKGKVRYRYYVSQALHQGDASAGMRVPAAELENVVRDRVIALFNDPLTLATSSWLQATATDLINIAARCSQAAASDRDAVRRLVDQVRICPGRIEIHCSTAAIAEALVIERDPDAPNSIMLECEVRLTRSGKAMRLIQNNGSTVSASHNLALIGLLIKARRWWRILQQGEVDVSSIAQAEGVQASYLTRVVRLAFLAPAVVDAILAGRALPHVDGKLLTLGDGIQPIWAEQRAAMLPS